MILGLFLGVSKSAKNHAKSDDKSEIDVKYLYIIPKVQYLKGAKRAF